MKITIHRGINQIGGCITEISTKSTKILIDLGHNLPSKKKEEDPKANKEAIELLTEDCRAIFYTHYHGDHVDLYKHVPEGVDQYIGETAKLVMQLKSERLATLKDDKIVSKENLITLESFKTFQAKQQIKIGDITVTPYFVSHSACDAYMFLIEADGKRVLHTGDFREHGYQGKGLIPTIEHYIIEKPVDVLITEGTMLSRITEKVKHENDLKLEAIALMEKYKYVFVLGSSTDMDRLATFHQASKDSHRSFLCDDYQKKMLDIFTKSSGGKSDLYKFDNTYFYKHNHAGQLKTIKEKGFCMMVRSAHINTVKGLLATLPAEETCFVYSMWTGYLKQGDNENQEYINMWNLFPEERRVSIHTSGHATPETLAKVCNLINPTTAIIPIHSEHSDAFLDLAITEELKNKIVLESTTNNDIEIIIHDEKGFYQRKMEYLESLKPLQQKAKESLEYQPSLSWKEKNEQMNQLRGEELEKLK